jgi:hypothetical protein
MNVKGTKVMMPISGVLHSPGVQVNLLSVDQFQRNGVDVQLALTGFTLQKDFSPVFKTTRYKGLYLNKTFPQIGRSNVPWLVIALAILQYKSGTSEWGILEKRD